MADLIDGTGPTASTAVLSVTGRIYTCPVTACLTRRTTGILATEEAGVADKAARATDAGRYGIGPKRTHVPTGAAVLRVGAQIIAGGTARGEPRRTATDTVGLGSGCDDPQRTADEVCDDKGPQLSQRLSAGKPVSQRARERIDGLTERLPQH